jgi:hypothetical protein
LPKCANSDRATTNQTSNERAVQSVELQTPYVIPSHTWYVTTSPQKTEKVAQFTRPIWPPDGSPQYWAAPVEIQKYLPELSPQERLILDRDDGPTQPWEPPEEQPMD